MTPAQRALLLTLATAEADTTTDVDALARRCGLTVPHAELALGGLQAAGIIGGDAGFRLRLLPPPALIADWESEGLTIER
jgi:DNA-binding IscR family transcriptional regulator